MYTQALSLALSRRHNIAVFHRESKQAEEEYRIERKKENGIDIYSINNTFRECYSFAGLYRNKTIEEKFALILDEAVPDIVHIQHLLFLSSGIVDVIKSRGIPIVFTLHDYWLFCPQWHCMKYLSFPCDGQVSENCVSCLSDWLAIRKGPKRLYHILKQALPIFVIKMLQSFYTRLAQRNTRQKLDSLALVQARREYMQKLITMVDVFIAPSEYCRERFVTFSIPKEKIMLLRHGVHIGTDAVKKDSPGKPLIFGYIGTLLPAKGVDVLINAFSGIDASVASLQIYGKLYPYRGFEYYPRLLKRLARGRAVDFKGEFAHSQIREVLSEIDVLVVPSLWQENAPLTILEAFASRVPVVASRIGGIPELIDDGVNGLLFNPGDALGLRDKLESLINNPGIINKLKQNIPQVKTIEENAQELELIYEKII
ncbi:MAG: glycosyltransferase [Candidatus Omnitrophota bacterium]